MGDVLVRYKKDKYRIWYTVVDAWITPIMKKEEAVTFLISSGRASSRKEAINRIDRKDLDRKHKNILKKFFDSKTKELSRLHYVRHGKFKPDLGWTSVMDNKK